MRLASSPTAVLPARPRATRAYGILTTFPPTACGIATFSSALAGALDSIEQSVGIVRVDGTTSSIDPRIRGVVGDGPGAATDAASLLDRFDVAIIQHEYGLYRGPDGDEVVDIVAALHVPSVVIAHTVLLDPTPHQRHVLEAVIDEADAVVVMTDAGRQRLCTRYDVDATKVVRIAHGATALPGEGPARPERDDRRPRMLTWGLLGPGKGIEWAIDALALLPESDASPHYTVAGRTHPKVAQRHGEAYREMLVQRSRRAGVERRVSFDPAYRDLASLARLLADHDVVVLPYDSVDQVTSGVLVDAVAAGRPVIATAFPHAEELLASGAGIVVPRQDPEALAAAFHRVITEPGLAASMAAEARRLAPQLGWTSVADQYTRVADRVLGMTAGAITA